MKVVTILNLLFADVFTALLIFIIIIIVIFLLPLDAVMVTPATCIEKTIDLFYYQSLAVWVLFSLLEDVTLSNGDSEQDQPNCQLLASKSYG